MSNIEALGADFQRDRAAAQMRTILHCFNILQHPEPYTRSVTQDQIDNGYYRMPEFELFGPADQIKRRTRTLKEYIGEVASFLALPDDVPLRPAFVVFGEATLTDYDHITLVDERGTPQTPDQLLPDTELLEAAAKAYNGNRPSTLLNMFVDRAVAELGDRAPKIF